MGASGDKREERNIVISEPQIFKKNLLGVEKSKEISKVISIMK